MRRHRIKDSLKSLLGSHIDTEKSEELKGTRTEIEDRVKRLLKFFRGEDPEENGKDPWKNADREQLIQLLEDLHQKYQSICDQYDHLTGELKKKAHGKQDKDGSSSSTDSDSNDSSRRSSKSGKTDDSVRIIEELRNELESVKSENAESKRMISSLIEEKEATRLEHQTALSKIEEAENIIKELKMGAQLAAQIVDQTAALQKQVESLQNENGELQLQLEQKTCKISEFLVQIESLKEEFTVEKQNSSGQIKELETELEAVKDQKKEVEDQVQFIVNEKEQIRGENEGLLSKLAEFEQKLESLLDHKSNLEVELENHKSELTTRTADHQRSTEDYEILQNQLKKYKVSVDHAEGKIEELETKLRLLTVAKEQEVAELEEMVDELKREMEMRDDELAYSVDNISNIEVKLRLSNQKLRVTEQLLTEKEEEFGKRMVEMSETIGTYERMIMEVAGEVNTTMVGLESAVKKLEGEFGSYARCIVRVGEDLQMVKNLVREGKIAEEEMKHKQSSLRDRAEKLEVKVAADETEKAELTAKVNHLSKKIEELEMELKDHDQGAAVLGEEKREAIRQLCIWIDYHRSRYEDLKDVLSKFKAKTAVVAR